VHAAPTALLTNPAALERMPVSAEAMATATTTLGGGQVWVYEEGNVTEAGNMYVHHDLMLSSFPLSVAWLDCVPGEGAGAPGNLVAIATFNPEIEIWDLDALDVVEPAGLLGGYEAGGQVRTRALQLLLHRVNPNPAYATTTHGTPPYRYTNTR
jgi:hypothetical protein